MKKLTVLAILVTLTLSISGCTTSKDTKDEPILIADTEEPSNTEETSKESSEETSETEEKSSEATEVSLDEPRDIVDILNGENNIRKDTYIVDRAYSNTKENVLFSPLSLEFAMGLAQAGAKDATKNCIGSYLNTEDYSEVASKYMDFTEDLNTDMDMMELSNNKIEIANSIWVSDESTVKTDYQNTVENKFKSEVNKVNFEDRSAAANEINSWANEKTHGLIPNIVSEESISGDTKALLVNSLYFNSIWEEKWEELETEEEFKGVENNTYNIKYMTSDLENYYENDNATAFGKYYVNGIKFIGILPKNVDENNDFNVDDLNIRELLESETTDYDVVAKMPKLNYDCTLENLKETLQELGMSTMFDGSLADLSGILEDENLCIDDILQKCKIILDEEKTEAAAVTEIGIKAVSIEMPEERETKSVELTRPFAFMIYDSTNDQILFIGKVVNPLS